MLLDRGAYLSTEGDSQSIYIALEKIWLDWQSKQLIQPIWQPIGVDQAVVKIINEVQAY
jgi:hypothetical protein